MCSHNSISIRSILLLFFILTGTYFVLHASIRNLCITLLDFICGDVLSFFFSVFLFIPFLPKSYFWSLFRSRTQIFRFSFHLSHKTRSWSTNISMNKWINNNMTIAKLTDARQKLNRSQISNKYERRYIVNLSIGNAICNTNFLFFHHNTKDCAEEENAVFLDFVFLLNHTKNDSFIVPCTTIFSTVCCYQVELFK